MKSKMTYTTMKVSEPHNLLERNFQVPELVDLIERNFPVPELVEGNKNAHFSFHAFELLAQSARKGGGRSSIPFDKLRDPDLKCLQLHLISLATQN